MEGGREWGREWHSHVLAAVEPDEVALLDGLGCEEAVGALRSCGNRRPADFESLPGGALGVLGLATARSHGAVRPALVPLAEQDHIQQEGECERPRDAGGMRLELPTALAALARRQQAARRHYFIRARSASEGATPRELFAWALAERYRELFAE